MQQQNKGWVNSLIQSYRMMNYLSFIQSYFYFFDKMNEKDFGINQKGLELIKNSSKHIKI